MKTFRHSGKCGDLIYALPSIQHLGGGRLYIPYDSPESPGMYENMLPFLQTIPYITEVIPYHHIGGYMDSLPSGCTHDLDRARLEFNRNKTYMVQRYFNASGIRAETPDKWLGIPHKTNGLTIVNVTQRHNDGVTYDWRNIPEGAVFVGTPEEYALFPKPIPYYMTRNFLELAQMVAGAKEVWCNQSATLTLAQALGKEYYCTFKANKTNCRKYGTNEHPL